MTRDEIKKRKRRDAKGLLLEAYHQARRHAAAGKLGVTASGDWLAEFEGEIEKLIDEAVDETAEAAHEAFKAAATVKTVPEPEPKQLGDGKPTTLPMNGQPQRKQA